MCIPTSSWYVAHHSLKIATWIHSNPTLVIEVLSQSTEFRDRGVKAQGYRLIDSLAEYLLIAQDRCRIEQYIQQADNHWLLVDFPTLEETVHLVSINCTLSIQDVYDRVLRPDGRIDTMLVR